MKIGSICSGMGMALHGLEDNTWGIEYDRSIADIYKMNHPSSRMICDRVQNVNPLNLEDVDCIVATPSCIRASVANAKAGESKEDIEVAQAIAEILKIKTPKFFILENVEGYKKFESFKLIQGALDGYYTTTQMLNLKDFGIAQSRKRMYLVAAKNSFFWDIQPPNITKGWYEAIQDLIPELPNTFLAKTQQGIGEGDRLIRRVGANKSNNRPYLPSEPVFTIRAFGRKCSNHWNQANVIVSEVIKSVTPQACIRFFGDKETADKIKLPTQNSLAMEVVGNGASWQIMGTILNQISGGNN